MSKKIENFLVGLALGIFLTSILMGILFGKSVMEPTFRNVYEEQQEGYNFLKSFYNEHLHDNYDITLLSLDNEKMTYTIDVNSENIVFEYTWIDDDKYHAIITFTKGMKVVNEQYFCGNEILKEMTWEEFYSNDRVSSLFGVLLFMLSGAFGCGLICIICIIIMTSSEYKDMKKRKNKWLAEYMEP